jgi:heptosyltransferase-1
VLPPSRLTELAGWLAHAHAVVGVDTGLAHLAAALGTPQLTLYGPTLPELTGAVGARQRWLRTDPAATTIDRGRINRVPLSAVQHELEEMLTGG